MTQLDLGESPAAAWPRPGKRARLLIALAALALTLVALAVAFTLGAVYFEARRFGLHERRLERLIAQQPTRERVEAGLAAEGSPLVVSPRDAAELVAWGTARAGRRRAALEAKAAAWPTARVHRATDMYYVLFYDAQGRLRDFLCLSAGGEPREVTRQPQ